MWGHRMIRDDRGGGPPDGGPAEKAGAGGPRRCLSRRRLLTLSASTAAGITLLTVVDPAQASGDAQIGDPAAGSGPRPSAGRSDAGRSDAGHGSAGQAGSGATATGTVPAGPQPVRRIRDLRPDAPTDAVALTIDDGPHPVWTPRILDVLRASQVSATFSLVGVQAAAHSALVRRIVDEGHTLCNHTMTHPQPFSRRTPEEIRAEMVRAQSAIVEAGAQPPRLFRAPGGDWSAAVLTAASGLDMTSLGWDVDPRDWARPGTVAIRRSLEAAGPGDILLCHDGGGNREQTVAALELVLPALRAKGLSFVAL